MGSTFPPCCQSEESIGQFFIHVRTRRQSNTSYAALRFKTLQDILHTCYIATFGVLTFIVPQGHKNVLPFIECTDSETPLKLLANLPKVEGTLARLSVFVLSLKCYPAIKLFGQGTGTLQQEGSLLPTHNSLNLLRDTDSGKPPTF